MSGDRFIRTQAIRAAVQGHEVEILAKLGIDQRGREHIHCPFPDHDDANPSWRWDGRKAQAFCTCLNGHSYSILDVIGRMHGLDFDTAKIRAAELIGRADLIEEKGAGGTKMIAAALLNPQADRSAATMPLRYLAHRLGVALERAPVPATPVAGWLDLEYFDPPAEKGAKPVLVGKHPCAVFGTVAPDGRTHAHRIYTAALGRGKAELDGRDPKKSASLAKGAKATGCAVIFGDRDRAPWLLLAEGIETAAAIAYIFRPELEAGHAYVAAAIAEANVGSFDPWPATTKVTVCADRDEAKRKSEPGYRAGEKAALKFARRHQGKIEVTIALPGDPGGKVDFLDMLLRNGADAVRAAIDAGEIPPGQPGDQGDADDRRERIYLSAMHFNRNLRDCARLLRDTIYLRGAAPFTITRAADAGAGRQFDDEDGVGVEIAGVRHRPGSLVFTAATSDRAAFKLDDRALFLKRDRRREEWSPVSCPAQISSRLVAVASDLDFRPCAGFARTPLLIKGKVISEPGWNAATEMILDPPADMPAIPSQPTKVDAARALKTLLQPFRGYLKDNADLEPVLAAAALTAALRASMPTSPAIILDGNTIGAGKGKAARALAILAVGGLPAVIPEGHNDEETEKRIAAAILQGCPALLLDNLQRTLASTTLESILTDPIARIRKFGSLSDDVITECRALVLITANNASLRRDLLRRTLPVRLVVPYENPERRHFDFDPVDEARRDRGKQLAAAFTIAKAWHLERDRPEHAAIRAKTLGSFEVWADLVAGVVEWLTDSNPIDVIEDRKDRDDAALAERGMVAQLARAFPAEERFTAAEAAAKIEPEAWRVLVYFKGERPDGRIVGNWLRNRKDRRFSIEDQDGHSHVATLKNAGTDRKGFATWQIAAGMFGTKKQGFPRHTEIAAEHAESVPSARAENGRWSTSVDYDTFGEVGETRSAMFGMFGTANQPNGSGERQRVGTCDHCGWHVFSDNMVRTESGALLHFPCVQLWSQQ
jgi:Toprim domain